MDVQFCVQFELGNTPQVFLQNGSFDFKLMFIIRVLIVAPATTLEVGASWSDAARRGNEDFF